MKLHPGYEKRPDDPNFVDMERTPLSADEMALYLREGFRSLEGEPTNDIVAILWSQAVLETGRDKNSMMRNYNYGNIKKNLDYSPNWTSYDAGEFLNGKHEMFYPFHYQTFFAAWKTPLDGAKGYITFLKHRKRYVKAWAELLKGDTVAFVRELKAGGYFTAPLDKYTALVVKLTNEFHKKYDSWTDEDWKILMDKLNPPVEITEPVIESEPELELVEETSSKIDLDDLNIELPEFKKLNIPTKDVGKLISVLMMIWNLILNLLKKK
jgi:hypothetical protein